jgi:uncharacterized protein YbjT (DUF2867 family)
MPKQPILVVGATGRLGWEICRRLLERRERVRAIVRPSSSACAVARLRHAGAEVVSGDLTEPESLAAACTGVRTVLSAATALCSRQPDDSIATVDERGHIALIGAAEQAGASAFVYVSLSSLIARGSPLERAKRNVERRLRSSRLAHTVLRPTLFMDTWLGPAAGFDLAARRVTVYGSGEERVTWIAAADVAEVAVACVEGYVTDSAALELGGPDSRSPREIVELAEQIGGRSIEIERVPLDALERARAAASNPKEESFAALFIHLARGGTMEPGRLSPRLPQPHTTVRHYVRMAL